LRDLIALLRGARNFAYQCDMSQLLRAVRLTLKPLTTIWISRTGTPTCANGKFASIHSKRRAFYHQYAFMLNPLQPF
jgi:hypothetical protein